MTLGARIKKARKARQLTQKQLSGLSGVSQQMISKLETNRSSETSDLVPLARALNVNPTWLHDGRGPMERKNGMNKALSSAGRASVTEIPLVSWDSVIKWSDIKEESAPQYGEETVTTATKTGPNGFVLIVEGEAMSPNYPEGGLIVVDPDVPAGPGDYVVAVPDGDGTAIFRRFEREGHRSLLVAENPRFPVERCAKIIGRVMSYSYTRNL